MDCLKLLLIFVIFAFGASGDGEDRQGRCGSTKPGKAYSLKQKGMPRKSIAIHGNTGHVFNGKGSGVNFSKLPSGATSIVSSSSGLNPNQQSKFPNKPTAKDPIKWSKEDKHPIPDTTFDDELGRAYGEDTGFAPRLQISADGEISFGRAINFDKVRTFHDDDQVDVEHNHDHHMDEDNSHFHKLRTVRSAPRDLRPQQLSSTLSNLNGQLQLGGVHNGAGASDHFQADAQGTDITMGSSGNSQAAGNGWVSSHGSTSVTSTSSGGWQKKDAIQTAGVHNGAGASDHFQATAQGTDITLGSSGNSQASGTGWSSTQGSMSITSTGSGWKS